MILLGITGPIGHGKSTFADALASQATSVARFESFFVVAEVADAMHAALSAPPDPQSIDQLNSWLKALPVTLKDITHTTCTYNQLALKQTDLKTNPVEYQKLILHAENLRHNPELAKTKITGHNKESYRPFLQWLGGYLVQKIDPGIWFNEIVRRVKAAQQQGVELSIVSGLRFPADADILRAAGGKIVKVYRPDYPQNDMQDPTERERENIQPDTTVISNGSAEDLERFAGPFLRDVKAGTLQKLYKTNPV